MAEKEKAQYAKPASQVDLEERLANGNKSDKVLSTADSYEGAADSGEARDYRVEGNDTEAYIGVAPEYQTYANDTEAPLQGDDSAENDVIASFAEGQKNLQAGVKSVDEAKEDAAKKAESSPQPKKTTQGSTSGN